MISILVVDDHPAYGSAVVSFLRAEKDLVVVALALDGEEAIELAAAWQPSIVLMDLVLSGMSGLSATRRILSTSPGSRVIILSLQSGHHLMMEAMRAGAAGYVSKEQAPQHIVKAIREVDRGHRFFPAPVDVT
ncbi:MAG: response regulator transcription factor [Acidimicrobiia bacterium]|nr:response regulator transcription factor [Acidimicrobiia bacterium]